MSLLGVAGLLEDMIKKLKGLKKLNGIRSELSEEARRQAI
jgi:hypothetical protein